MNDKNQQNKELESMTDKVTEQEGTVDSNALQSLTNADAPVSKMRIPHETDIDNLKKNFVSTQHSK